MLTQIHVTRPHHMKCHHVNNIRLFVQQLARDNSRKICRQGSALLTLWEESNDYEWFPSQRAGDAESVSMSWRHHGHHSRGSDVGQLNRLNMYICYKWIKISSQRTCIFTQDSEYDSFLRPGWNWPTRSRRPFWIALWKRIVFRIFNSSINFSKSSLNM